MSNNVYRLQGRSQRPSSGDPLQGIQIPARTREEKAAQQVAFWTLFVTGMIVCAGTAGAVIGWVTFFAPDNNYAQRFGALAQEDVRIQTAIDNERSVREASDLLVQSMQDALNVGIVSEIANRTSQDMQLMSLLAAEVAAREAFQALLRQLLGDEVTYRLGNDTVIDTQLTGLEVRLATLNAYDVYALQQFMIKMGNLTNLSNTLAGEIATRQASDAVLSAQDAAQINSIASLGPAIAAERATRMAYDDVVSSLLDPLVDGGLFSINGMPGVQNNFNLNAAPGCAFVVGSGGGNVITLSNNAILSLAGLQADPTTNNIGIMGDGNVVVTPNPGGNSIGISLATTIPAQNIAVYSGSTATLADFASDAWQFDLGAIGSYITNYDTGYMTGWEIPVDGSGLTAGIWVVEIKFVQTWLLTNTPMTRELALGYCIQTLAYCRAFPSFNFPAKTYRFSDNKNVNNAGLNNAVIGSQDIVMEFTTIVDGRGLPAGFGVYPVWRSEKMTDGGQMSHVTINGMSVTYRVSRIY